MLDPHEASGNLEDSDLKSQVLAEVDRLGPELLSLSHRIHDNPEVSWSEREAASLLAETLRTAGFAVTEGAYGIPTSVEAVLGSGDLTVAICAEYDALAHIGHACGHNIIAAAGVGAAMALAPFADRIGLRIKLLGTPAEEHGGGKVRMLAAGAWEDVDFSLMVHPYFEPDLSAYATLSTAVERFEVEFRGRAAHAAGSPEEAINASAAATLAQTAIALLRQHLPRWINLNTFVSRGGEVTNIIPDVTVIQGELRAHDLLGWGSIRQRVLASFEGAAIATGCEWSWQQTEHVYAPLRPDVDLARIWDRNLASSGRRATDAPVAMGWSTDMGNVSQVVPSIHPMIAIKGVHDPLHTTAFEAAASSPAADDTVIDAACLLASTIVDVAQDEELRSDLRRRRARRAPGATQVLFSTEI